MPSRQFWASNTAAEASSGGLGAATLRITFRFALLEDRSRSSRKEWCCQTGLNCRPLHYQWSALPLSYGSKPQRGISLWPTRRADPCHKAVGRASRGGCVAANRAGQGDRYRGGRTAPVEGLVAAAAPACMLNSPAPPRSRIGRIRTPERNTMIDNRDTDRDAENGKRRMRLRAALRENLKRRKSQSRGRADQAASAEDPEPECRDE